MVQTLHPGIYVQEVPGARSITGASTSVAVFIGVADIGQTNVATQITSWNAYTRQFGGYVWNGFMPWAVSEFFAEGGLICWIVRTDTASGKAASATVNGSTLKAATPGTWGNSLSVVVHNAVPSTDANPPQSTIYTLDVVVEAEKLAAATLAAQMLLAYVTQNGITKAAGKSYYVLESFGGLTLTDAGFAARINANSMFIRATEGAASRPPNATTQLANGTAVTYDFPTSLAALDQLQGVSLLAMPDTVAVTTADGKSDLVKQSTFINGAQQKCQNLANLFYVADPPYGLDPPGIVAFKTGATSGVAAQNSSYSALYYPWVWIYNPIAGAMVPIPPSGPALGRYASTDVTVGVFKSPAGVTDGTLRTVSAVDVKLTDVDQDTLNPNGINAVRNLINYGNVLWGARTVSQDTQWTYISVRRLFIFVEQSLRNSLQWVVFESNSPQLWSAVTRDISAFLTTLWRQGGLFGTSAAEAFFVTCDASNNPPETRRQGQLYIDIGLAPVYPAEFVILRLTQKTAGPDSGS